MSTQPDSRMMLGFFSRKTLKNVLSYDTHQGFDGRWVEFAGSFRHDLKERMTEPQADIIAPCRREAVKPTLEFGATNLKIRTRREAIFRTGKTDVETNRDPGLPICTRKIARHVRRDVYTARLRRIFRHPHSRVRAERKGDGKTSQDPRH